MFDYIPFPRNTSVKAVEILAEILTQDLLTRSLKRPHDNLLNNSSSICLNLIILSLFLLFNHLFRSVHFIALLLLNTTAPPPPPAPPSGAFSIIVYALRVAESLAQELELERKSRQQQQQQQQQADRDVKSPLQGEGVQ